MKKLFVLGFTTLFYGTIMAQDVQSSAAGTSGGFQAGLSSASLGESNTFYGYQAGKAITTGNANVFIGSSTGSAILTGTGNVCVGARAGLILGGQDNNTFIGNNSGASTNGYSNVMIGNGSGFNGIGTGNICIGNNSGYFVKGSPMNFYNQLFIDNSNTLTPLIWGDFANDLVKLNGKVGIGGVTAFPTTSGGVNVSGYKLFVTGGILADEVRVNLSSGGTWADYVFAKEYKLPTLLEVENQIKEKGHLINVPSAKEINENGIALGEMAKIQQEKIEELTLYIIEQNKINEKQNKEIEELKALVKNLAAKK